MIPWLLVDTAKLPDESGELRLMQRGDEFSIRVGAAELMNSRRGASEQALASMSCARIGGRERPHVLIGGLGMGFTLGAALAEVGAGAEITVAELVPSVIAWAKGPMAGLFGKSLLDPRVSLCEADVARLIRSNPATYDAILLDVDNGPEGLTCKANDRLYSVNGLRAARTALRPGGVVAVWSSGSNRNFARRLQTVGFTVEEIGVRANGTRGARHVIWIGTSGAQP